MEMINVLKRLAELDAGNPNVESMMTPPQSLTTVRDAVLEESVQETPEELAALAGVKECGMMGAPVAPQGAPHTPASVHITANSGDEISSMLRTIMSLAGTDKGETHQEIELGTPHVVAQDDGDDLGGDLSSLMGMIDKNSDDSLNPADDEEGDEEEKENWDNSPEPEIEPHDYGDKQVTPKPQGLKQRMGDNPYKPATESVDDVAARLMDDYKQFVNESNSK